MAVSPTGPLLPGTAVDAGGGTGAWTNVSNALIEDGNVAYDDNVGPGGGGFSPDQLNTTNFGFSIPSSAIIDGIKLEIKASTTDEGGGSVNDSYGGGGVYLVYNGGHTSYANTPNSGQFWPSSGLIWLTYGGSTSLWGRTWTGADINNSNFGASMSASAGHSTSRANVDAVRITVWWHSAPAVVPKRYYYQVFNNGNYLGDLPNVTSDFNFSQDINTAGSQITVTCGVSPDIIALPNSFLLDESGSQILDENNVPIGDEGIPALVGLGNGSALVRNGNQVIITEVSYWWPNGKIVFRGMIQHWEGDFGGDGGSEDTSILIYSDGADLDNHLVKGNPYTYTLDQSQVTENASDSLVTGSGAKGSMWNMDGQTFKTGSGVTNIGAITVYLYGTANVTVNLYTGPDTATLLGTTTQYVSVGGATAVQFNFPATIPVSALTTYFFTVAAAPGQSITIYYQNTNPYANGQMYNSNYGGGSGGGGWYPESGNDLYFQTYSGSGSTTATYTSVDPTAGMLEPIMNSYLEEGGLINYTSSSIQTTGLSVSYKWNTNTIYESLQGTLTVAPSGYYYTVDLGSDILTFKAANATPDITLIKGFHVDKMHWISTIEQIVNRVFFTGGLVSGSNIYTLDSDAVSTNLYGIHLDRPTNNQILDTTTAHTIAQAEIKQLKQEQNQTSVTLIDHKIDFTSVKPGMTVGFAGWGEFVDGVVLQIVRIDYAPEELTLTLGILPKKLHKAVEQTVRGYVGLQTVDNPTTPS